ncbi:hypothetical protein K474DRAFT_122144 [Panus rudis PR-1116 ss-1]|nr:hypothetical protein K474DRAFT_122144 [Panus rudis PR-1116 ss-1]
MSTDTSDIQAAPAPFNAPNGNLILRTADGYDFHVYKLILSHASPWFASMFTLPQDPNTPGAGGEIQKVPVTERSSDLDLLLRTIYSTPRPELDWQRATTVLELGRKYDMEVATQFVEFFLKENIKTSPVAVYAMARRFELKSLAAKAAKETLNISFEGLLHGHGALLDRMSGADIRELIAFHDVCGQPLGTVVPPSKLLGLV